MIEADEGGNAYIKRSTDGSGHRSGEIYQNDLTPGKKCISLEKTAFYIVALH